LWKFVFGKRRNNSSVVDMEIHGSIKLKCLRASCQHINTLTFFPNQHIDNK
jgi:hypothetical protein